MIILCTKEWEKWDEELRIRIENEMYKMEDAIDKDGYDVFVENGGRKKYTTFPNGFFVVKFTYRKVQLRFLCRYNTPKGIIELHKNYCKNKIKSNGSGEYYKIYEKYVDEYNKKDGGIILI